MVFEKVREIVAEQMSVSEDEIVLETTFKEDLDADSLDIFQIVSTLEEYFEMEFNPDDAEKIKTVADAVKYVEQPREYN
ncbi:MAG: acyl carrier protein [bacterium]